MATAFEDCFRGRYQDLSLAMLPAVLELVAQGGMQYPQGALFLNLDKAEGFNAMRASDLPADPRLFDLLALIGSRFPVRKPHIGRWARDRIAYLAAPVVAPAPFRDIGYLFHDERAG
jgi:hypothetical protein